MNRTQAVNCAAILDYSKDHRKTAVETPSDTMVMGTVWALCEISLLFSQQNYYNQSCTVLGDELKRFSKSMGAFEYIQFASL